MFDYVTFISIFELIRISSASTNEDWYFLLSTNKGFVPLPSPLLSFRTDDRQSFDALVLNSERCKAVCPKNVDKKMFHFNPGFVPRMCTRVVVYCYSCHSTILSRDNYFSLTCSKMIAFIFRCCEISRLKRKNLPVTFSKQSVVVIVLSGHHFRPFVEINIY